MTTQTATPTRPWLGPSKYKGWTISAPWQSKIAGPFEAQVYREMTLASGKTGELCYLAACEMIDKEVQSHR